jgi:hypothetical protein
MSRYAVGAMAMLLVSTAGSQAIAQDKAHAAKPLSLEQRLRLMEDKDEIREFVSKTYPPNQYPGSYHIMSSPSIQIIDANTATAWSRWTYVVLGVHGEPAPFAAGHYEDTLVRHQGVWKFKRRTVFAEARQP